MPSRTALFSLLLLVTLAASAKAPCDPADPTSLCLRPLRRSAPANAPSALSSATRRRRGGGGFGRRPTAAAAGGIVGAAVGAGRRPRRGRGGGFDDEEEEETFDGNDDDDDGDDDDDFCFPANSMVTVQGKGLVRMADVSIGDSVMLASGAFSTVFVFGHRLTRGQFPFIKITTNDGQLTVSKGHYIYADGHLVTAETVRTGSSLELANGQPSVVSAVENVVEEGLFNPHTLDGELVVDGFRVSAYTKTVQPVTARSMLAPVRAAFRIVGIDVTAGAMSATAPKFLLNRLPKGAASTEL